MGYTTDFEGKFNLDKPLTVVHANYLKKFGDTRRMKRDPEKAAALPDPEREAVGLPIGIESEYFVGGIGVTGQTDDESVTDHNTPASTQPGLWCQWVPTADGQGIEWDGCEKFYHYTQWLEYIIANFLKPWGYTLSGEVKWFGEDRKDMGVLRVVQNVVTTVNGTVVYE